VKKILLIAMIMMLSGCVSMFSTPILNQYTIDYTISLYGTYYTGHAIAYETEEYSYVYYETYFLSGDEIVSQRIDVFLDDEVYSYIYVDEEWVLDSQEIGDITNLSSDILNPFKYLSFNPDWFTYSESDNRYYLKDEFKPERFTELTGNPNYVAPEPPYESLYSNYITLDDNGDIATSYYNILGGVALEFVDNIDEYNVLPQEILFDLDIK